MRMASDGEIPPAADWPAQVVDSTGAAVRVPSAGFKEMWETMPLDDAADCLNKEYAPAAGIRKIAMPGATPSVAALLLLPADWLDEMWVLDNLYFLAEHGRKSYAPSNAPGEGSPQNWSNLIAVILADPENRGLPLELYIGGAYAGDFVSIWENLPDTIKIRVCKVVFLNPTDVVGISGIKNSLIYSNNRQIDHGMPNFRFCRASGASFGRSYFDVLDAAVTAVSP